MHRRYRSGLPSSAPLSVGGRPRRDERGTSIVGTTFGFAVFLGFLLFAVNLALGLYARSTATAIGFDQARLLAQRGGSCIASALGTELAVARRLDGWWRQVVVTAGCDGERATVRIDASSSRSLLPSSLLRPTGLSELHRSFTVRVEALR